MADEDLKATRHSKVVYVVTKLQLNHRDYFLLYEHPKWGDWSLVGGHVEPGEDRDWIAAARREAEEEMKPLRIGEDVDVEPLVHGPEQWGPQRSQSSGNRPTLYSARWFVLRFLHDPRHCLSVLPRDRFLLVERSRLESDRDTDLTSLVERLESSLPRGLDDVPYAWPPERTLSLPPLPRRDARSTGRSNAASG